MDEYKILDYDLDVDDSIGDHDLACIDQAGRLMKIGYLEYETAVYAIAYRKNQEIYYFMSDYVVNIEQQRNKLLKENIYTTPIRYFFKRYDLVEETEEEVKHKFRLEVARTLATDYSELFFDAIETLIASSNTNSAYSLLKEISKQLDSCFDMNELILFDNLLDMMLNARLLSMEGYQLLQQWLRIEFERIAYEPVDYGQYKRQYYGFAYQKNGGKIKYFIDAVKYKVYSRQVELIRDGYVVTPILRSLYQRESYHELYFCKKQFEQLLQQYTGERYLSLMCLLNDLPSSVDSQIYETYLNSLQDMGTAQEIMDFLYYGRLWIYREKS